MPGIDWVEGGLLSVRGFRAHGDHVGIKAAGRDLAIIASEVPCSAAAVATRNAFRAAPVELTLERASTGRLQAVVANSGVANAGTGPRGRRDAEDMARLAAQALGIEPALVAVASTGTIGEYLPMAALRAGIPRVVAGLPKARGGEAAEAIMTTDRRPKEASLRLGIGGRDVGMAIVAKGSGMVAPNMGTMLAFIVSDVKASPAALRRALKGVVEGTFNMLDIDGDTSCNDMVVALANGRAGNRTVGVGGPDYRALREALAALCVRMVRSMASDGDGATKALEVRVTGAPTDASARAMAKAVVGSLRVKAAVHGGDPNWGRVLVAAGMEAPSGLKLDRSTVAMGRPGRVEVVARGGRRTGDRGRARSLLKGPEVVIELRLHQGKGRARAWGCDLSTQYVEINADYEAHLRAAVGRRKTPSEVRDWGRP